MKKLDIKRILAPAALIIAAALATNTEADAQWMPAHAGHEVLHAGPYGDAGGGAGSISVPPYSYFAAFPEPARIYVGYGDDGFPFQGRPYGHSYDRWSWGYFSGSYGPPARYFFPPLP